MRLTVYVPAITHEDERPSASYDRVELIENILCFFSRNKGN